MSIHINELACGPRALMIIAEKIGKPINPDLIWEKFCSGDNAYIAKDGSIYISTLLDMAREFGIARHLDITRDSIRMAQAMQSQNVVGVLMITEWPVNSPEASFQSQRHVWALHRILAGTSEVAIEVESANRGSESRVHTISETALDELRATFLILLKERESKAKANAF